MPRITIDLTAGIQRHAGIGRYAEELTRALLALQSGDEIRLFYIDSLGRTPMPPLDTLPRRTMRWSNKPWRMRVLLSTYARLPMDHLFGDTDIFHATDHLLPPLQRIRTAFTLYDLSVLTHPDTHLPLNRGFLQMMLPRFLRNANAIIAISENTRRDAARWLGVPQDKMSVIYPGVSSLFRPINDAEHLARVRAKYHLPARFILYFGTIEPRKNLLTLLEAYRFLFESDHPAPDLVIAGHKGWLHQPIFQRVHELGLEKQVRFTGHVPEEDAPAIMNIADVFVYPSLYEGFGLPPLEAMACGTPVICSNVSSLPEVVGDSGILVDPRDAGALAEAMARVLADEALRVELRARGLIQAQKFSWERAARATLAVYQSIIAIDL